MSSDCLNEEQLISLYYEESDSVDEKQHMRGCEACQLAFARLCRELGEIDMPVPDGGYRAVAEAIKLINRQEPSAARDEIMTIEEVAEWLKVSYHSIVSTLHQLPHFVVDGNVRFNRRLLEDHLFNSRSASENSVSDQPRSGFKVMCGHRVA
jgi:hypothetical protein